MSGISELTASRHKVPGLQKSARYLVYIFCMKNLTSSLCLGSTICKPSELLNPYPLTNLSTIVIPSHLGYKISELLLKNINF